MRAKIADGLVQDYVKLPVNCSSCDLGSEKHSDVKVQCLLDECYFCPERIPSATRGLLDKSIGKS